MDRIWYLLKCPEGYEADYIEKCQELTEGQETTEIICFQYHRMMRYRGSWHLERRALLPGYIFLFGEESICLEEKGQEKEILLRPCERPFVKMLCSDGDNLIGMSEGIIKEGTVMVTKGPLRGKESLIRKIDRHKRTAEIEIPFEGRREKQITVGLEIYDKR